MSSHDTDYHNHNRLRRRIFIYSLVEIPDAAKRIPLPKALNIAFHVQNCKQHHATNWVEKALRLNRYTCHGNCHSHSHLAPEVIYYGKKMIVDDVNEELSGIEMMVLLMEHDFMSTKDIDSVDEPLADWRR